MGPEDAHKYWNRKADERQAQQVATRAATAPATPEASPNPTRSFGFQSGAARGAAEGRVAETANAGAALGEPTSFRGGEGAPPPVAIMRGTRTTFQNPAADQGPGGGYVQTPGSSPQEYATPVQAGQAWNQGMRNEAVAAGDRRGFTTPEATLDTRYGGFRAPGQTLAEITAKAHVEGSAAAAKNPYYDAMAGKVKAETAGVEATNRKTDLAANQATLRKQLEEEVGVPSADGKNLSLPVDPGFQAIHKKMDRLTMQGVSPEEAYKAVAPELHKHYYTPENLYGAINLMEKQTGQPVPPELKKQLMSGTPEAMQALYPYTRQAAQQPRGVVARTFNPAPAVGPAATQLTPPGGTVAPVQGGPNNAWATPWKIPGGPKGELSESEKIPQF